ncbi:Uncharacterised protein [Mycobacterium tuberculosis]|nr:Uncharacterised protein [Mycobacterium tuberculosis]
MRRSSWPSGLGVKRATYQSPFRQAVSSSSDPLSSCWATRSTSVCSSTSIKVVRSIGCSLLITRSRPRRPACSRLALSPESCGFTIWACLVTTNKRGSSPSNSASSRVIRTR